MSENIRKQIYIRKDQDKAIKLIAIDKGIRPAEVVREALDEYLERRKGK